MTTSNDVAFASLRQSADPSASDVLERLVTEGDAAQLARINPVSLASDGGLDEDGVIAALLHGTRLGLFDMSWNVLCPSCRGTLDARATLRGLRHDAYRCALCAIDAEPTLDDTVEVSFTVSPRLRAAPTSDPETLGFWDYCRDVFFSTSLAWTVPGATLSGLRAVVTEAGELHPGERTTLSLSLADVPLVVFDPVSHSAHVVRPEGEPATQEQRHSVVLSGRWGDAGRTTLRPGPLTVTIENRSDRRALPGVFQLGPNLFAVLADRRRYLTAKRLLSNQTFRDLHRTDTLGVDQRFKMTNLTFLFTDLRGSTELYEQVGDLAAYDLVQAHFRVLTDIVAEGGGAVVKTIGDAVMATFPEPDKALSAALRMREAMGRLNRERGLDRLALKIGIHAGPCLAVNLNDRQDYFGQTVNIASRVQALADAGAILVTDAIAAEPACAALIATRHSRSDPRAVVLKGVGVSLAIHHVA
jgi:class 3 adenylate cyclase